MAPLVEKRRPNSRPTTGKAAEHAARLAARITDPAKRENAERILLKGRGKDNVKTRRLKQRLQREEYFQELGNVMGRWENLLNIATTPTKKGARKAKEGANPILLQDILRLKIMADELDCLAAEKKFGEAKNHLVQRVIPALEKAERLASQ